MSKKEQHVAILVGDGDELMSFYANYHHSDRIEGIFCSEGILLPQGLKRLGNLNDALFCTESCKPVSRVYCGISRLPIDVAQRLQMVCKIRAVKFFAVLPVVNSLKGKFIQTHVGGEMMLTPSAEPLVHVYNRLLKRLFDLFFVIVFMLLFFPFVYIYKAIVLKRKKRGPSFSTQYCCGPSGKPFCCVSFRDEKDSLARVFNVLTGQMSLVGPEAYVLSDKDAVDSLPRHMVRSMIKPGMTGWSQLNKLEGNDRMNGDIWYAEHWSLWLDIRILLQSMLFKK